MASIINASTSGAGGVITTADSSGTLILQSGGTNVATITATGANAGIQVASFAAPTFSAYKSATQTGISNSTWTKITFDVEEWDTNNNFASSTFTPTVAGYYQIDSSVAFNATVTNPNFTRIGLYKNGTIYKTTYIPGTSNDRTVSNLSAMVYMNGTTDYIEIYGFMTGASGGQFDAGTAPIFTSFSGFLARSA